MKNNQVLIALVALIVCVCVRCGDISQITSVNELNYLNSWQSASSYEAFSFLNDSLVEFISKNVLPQLPPKDDGDKVTYLKASSKKNMPTFWKGTPQTYLIDRQASVSIKTTQILKKLAFKKKLPTNILKNIRIPTPYCYFVDRICCDPYAAYRTLNGSCNNLNYPTWGMALAPYKRLLPPEYNDDLNEPKVKSAATGHKLPNARRIATTLHDRKPAVSEYSTMFIFFAQMVDHDILTTATTTFSNGDPVVCDCDSKSSDCINIPIINQKEYIFPASTKCIPLVRSAASNPDYECNLGHREQLNMQSAWADLSNFYGVDSDTANSMRTFTNGQLKVSYSGNSVNLAYIDEKAKCDPSKQEECYKIGDSRGQTNVMLMSVYNLFVRQHNRFAYELLKINPLWNDEKLFQEARKINTAVYQHIIYKEFLPLMLGRRVYEAFKLEPKRYGHLYAYESDKYPNTLNEATFAFRLHAMVNSHMCQSDRSLQRYDISSVGDFVFNITKYVHGADGILYGMIKHPSYYSSPFVSSWLNHNLFDKFQMKASLPAITNQRTRDHGIPAYHKYRELCGLGSVRSWNDLLDTIPKTTVDLLKQLYDSPLSVEFYAGGSSEISEKDALLPPTFACILGKQFHDLKHYDRFYYEMGNDVNTRFSEPQLNQIRYATMAGVLCMHSDAKHVPANPFLLHHKQHNPMVDCDQIRDFMSLYPWKVNVEAYQRLINNADLEYSS